MQKDPRGLVRHPVQPNKLAVASVRDTVKKSARGGVGCGSGIAGRKPWDGSTSPHKTGHSDANQDLGGGGSRIEVILSYTARLQPAWVS